MWGWDKEGFFNTVPYIKELWPSCLQVGLMLESALKEGRGMSRGCVTGGQYEQTLCIVYRPLLGGG